VVWVSAGIFLKSYPRAPIHLDLKVLFSDCYREEKKGRKELLIFSVRESRGPVMLRHDDATPLAGPTVVASHRMLGQQDKAN
jgi:hypothetical protein